MLKKDSWRIIETVLLRYPEKKREYEEYLSDIMSNTGSGIICGEREADYSKPQSVTEAKALKMTSVYYNRLKNEINAVEFVYNNLRTEEQKIIRMRYWTGRKPVPYLKLEECSYSERQMKRIVYKTIIQIGKYIGEIR